MMELIQMVHTEDVKVTDLRRKAYYSGYFECLRRTVSQQKNLHVVCSF